MCHPSFFKETLSLGKIRDFDENGERENTSLKGGVKIDVSSS